MRISLALLSAILFAATFSLLGLLLLRPIVVPVMRTSPVVIPLNGTSSFAYPQDELLTTPLIHLRVNELYKRATLSFFGMEKMEYAFTVSKYGIPRPITSSHEPDKDHLTVYAGDLLIIHTHPKGADPRPSPGDFAAAKECGIPNYELSIDALWVAMPDGTSHKVGSVQMKHGDLIIG